MALEVYYPEDVRRALEAADAAEQLTLIGSGAEQTIEAKAFHRGYQAAIGVIATAFGLKPESQSLLHD